MADVKQNTQGVGLHVPPLVKHGMKPMFAIDIIDLGSDEGSFNGADLIIAPLLGLDLKLDQTLKTNPLRVR